MDVFAVLRIGADFIAWQNHKFIWFVETVGDFAERVHAVGNGAVLFRALFGGVVGIVSMKRGMYVLAEGRLTVLTQQSRLTWAALWSVK